MIAKSISKFKHFENNKKIVKKCNKNSKNSRKSLKKATVTDS